MDRVIYYTILFDIYGDLLTEKQQRYFKDYYFLNLSLQEIAENYQVSRNAIYNQLKDTRQLLHHYEEVLHVAWKQQQLEEIYIVLKEKDIREKLKKVIDT